MGRYRKLSHRLWTGSLGRRLRVGAVPSPQALAPYLVGCEHGNMIGLYRLPLAYIAADLGWDSEGSSKTLRRLSEEGYVKVDEESERVWVIELFRHEFETDRKETDVNSAKAIAALLAEAGSSFLVREFLDFYRPTHPTLLRLCEDPPKTLRRPSEGVLAGARALPDPEQEQEQEQETPTESCAELAADGDSPPLDDPVAYWIPVVKGTGKPKGVRKAPGGFEAPITMTKVEEWKATFDQLDVDLEIRKAIQWCKDRPAKRKTPRGVDAYIGGWLTRTQNRSGGQASQRPQRGEYAEKLFGGGR